MAFATSRPRRDPTTGIYFIGKRVPAAIRSLDGREIHRASLGTKDPKVAKERHMSALAALELD